MLDHDAQQPPSARALCKNCGAALGGPYCAQCGQSADVHVPSTRELVHEVLEGLTHSDSRVWRSLGWLWFKPGKLTEEFIAGRRAFSLPPFRLYLIASVVFFLVAAASPGIKLETVRSDDPLARPAELSDTGCSDLASSLGPVFAAHYPGANERILRACTEIRRDGGKSLSEVMLHTLPKAMFAVLPLMALAHMLLYWYPRRRYAEHLIFFLHLQAFYFSVGTLMILIGKLNEHWPQLGGVLIALKMFLGLSLPVYTLFAMRRVFHNGWPLTLLKAVALAICYLVAFSITWVAVFTYAALML